MHGDRDKALVQGCVQVPLWLIPVLENLPVGVAVFDEEGGLSHANSHYRQAVAQQAGAGETLAGNSFSVDGQPLAQPAFPCIQILESAETRAGEASETAQPFAQFGNSAVVEADPSDGHITYLSPAAQQLLAVGTGAVASGADGAADWVGQQPCGQVARRWEINVHPADLPLTARCRVEAGDGHFQPFEYRIVDSQGRVARHIRETSFPIPARSSAIKRVGGLLQDVSPEVMIYLVQPLAARDISLVVHLGSEGARVTTFETQEELLRVAEVLNPGCVILDIRHIALGLPDMLQLLRLRPEDFQVILVGCAQTPPGDIIAALRAGAADYLVEPHAAMALPGAVHAAAQHLTPASPLQQAPGQLRPRLEALSRREREVLNGLVNGGTNKSIARALAISPRTVETHRANLMQRLNCRSLTELLHVAHEAGLKQLKDG